MNYSMRIAAGAMIAAMALPALAEQLTPQEALARALREPVARTLSVGAEAASSRLQLTYTGRAAEKSTFYVFNSSKENGGFCIVAADDVVSTPLLGYSDNGEFDPNNIPVNMRDWLEEYSRQIAWMASQPATTAASSTILFDTGAAERRDIAPLCATKWDQSAPYNELCPKVNNKSTYTGCVATSMAQVMKAHNWPDTGEGTKSYVPDGMSQTLTVDFSKSKYDWANMTDTYSATSTEVEKAAVARLMYDCGVSVNMMYTTQASGALSTAIPNALVTYFKYDKGIRQMWRDDFYLNEWIDILYTELSENRPVLCGGSNSGGGHAFVIDGYRKEGNYFHLNWGWSGMSDGYFLITALDPESQGAGGSAAGYNTQQIITIGIQPAKDDSKVIPTMGANTAFVTKKAEYSRSAATLVEFFPGTQYYGVFSYSSDVISVRMGVKLVSSDGEVSYLDYPQAISVNPNTGFTSYPVPSTKFPTEGTYTVTPAFQCDGEWYDIPTPIFSNRELRLEASASTLKFTNITPTATAQLTNMAVNPTPLYAYRPFNVEFKIKATKGEYYNTLYLVLIQNNNLVSILEEFQVDLLEGTSRDFSFTAFVPQNVPAGNYTLIVGRQVNGMLNTLGFGKAVTILAEPALSYRLSDIAFGPLGETGLTQSKAAHISLKNFEVSAKLTATSGFFADQVTGLLYAIGNYTTPEAMLPGKYVSADTGETAEIKLTGDLSTQLEPNTIYSFTFWGNYLAGQMQSSLRYVKFDAAGIEDVTESMDEMQLFVSDNSVVVTAPATITSAEIFAMNGVRVAAECALSGNQATMAIDGVPAGVYVARVTMIDGNVESRRIVIK